MQPKTKLHFEVLDLHKCLKFPKEHEEYMISKHDFYYTDHYKSLVCLECNHKWRPNQMWQEKVLGIKCPSCKKELNKKISDFSRTSKRVLTYVEAISVGRFQVFRYFSCYKYFSKSEKPTYSFRSLFEEWKEFDKNKRVVIGRTEAQAYYSDGFSYADYEIRHIPLRGYSHSIFDRYAADYNLPVASFHHKFNMYQLNSYTHDCDYRLLLDRIENSPRAETLFKAKEKVLLEHLLFKNNRHNNYWPQIKMVIRNKYKITDAGIWYDYLNLCEYFKMDILNAKFACPDNLKKEHDILSAKKNSIMAAERALREEVRAEEERLKKIERENAPIAYIERTKKFFDLEIKKGKISITVLKSVEEFQEEGKELHHCVNSNQYFLKKGSLILSAKVDGKRMETIEVKLSNFTITQSRGLNNNPTEYHEAIVSLMRMNMNKIKNIISPVKPKPVKKKTSKSKALCLAS
jgi:hypothetical protein